MIALKLALLFATAIFAVTAEDQTSSENYKLVRFYPESNEHVDLISKLHDDVNFDIWKASEKMVDILFSPESADKYLPNFDSVNLKYEIINHNIQQAIDQQTRSISKRSVRDSIVGKFGRFSEILSYIQDKVLDYPDMASTEVIGKTYENRDLRIIKIKTPSSQRKIWIDCGIHAREWISPATCVYMIERLLSDYNNGESQAVELLNYYEFHILPVMNPDGYEYTWNSNRRWRKNRNPTNSARCVGVDLNRNFGYKWLTGGSSTNPCSDTYAGPEADSELETQAVEQYLTRYQGDWDSYLTLHSFGQWWFTTWGYTRTRPENYNELNEKAGIGARAIQSAYNTKWVYGQSSTILYIASGGSEDWAAGELNITYAYCLELRPGQSGPDSQYGFYIPEDRVFLAGNETFGGIKAFLKSIKPTTL